MKKINLIGKKFGRLTVVKEAPSSRTSGGHSVVRWYCKCDCGNPNLILVSSNNLKSGNTNSCGCYFKDRMIVSNKQNKHKMCHYDLDTHDYGIGTTLKGDTFIFDKEDYDKIKNICWFKRSDYFIGRNPNTSKYETLSRVIMDIYTDDNNIYDVDHIDTNNKNDNRKQNLRIVTTQQNCSNRKKSIVNTSGTPGVSWHKRLSKWQAYISFNNKRKYLGVFNNLEDAINARKEAEEKYYGDYSYDNSQKIANKNKKENA